MNNHDINKLPTDGYIIFPLSMSRLANSQNPEACYKMIKYFETKISAVGLDLILLYTNGLYYNNTEPALDVRKRTNAQMISHRNALRNLVIKDKKYIIQAMHFLPWDYTILDSPQFEEFFRILKEAKDTDSVFLELLRDGLGEREENEANINFLIEEIIVTHLIREHMISFPKTLVQKDTFRLMVYPGPYFEADRYQWEKQLLPKNKDCINPYRAAHYDFNEKTLTDFAKSSKS